VTNSLGLLDKKALARELSVSARTIDNLMARRAIPYIKVGRLVRFDVQKVKAALARFEVHEVASRYVGRTYKSANCAQKGAGIVKKFCHPHPKFRMISEHSR
jgi:excisionase family DNA binding protein